MVQDAMPAAKRVGNLTLVLVPSDGLDDRTKVMTHRMGCAAAYAEKLQPISPLLFYAVFLPPSELEGAAFRQNVLWWAKRVDAIWVCIPSSVEAGVDELLFQVLMQNERRNFVPRKASDPCRLPIYRVTWTYEERYDIQRITRDELDLVLKCNVVAGLLKGGLE